MQLHHWFALALALTPSLASAALFPKDSLVKQIDTKGFKKAMKENATSVVAFVAPWCGHCQKMAPEFSKAALGVYPMIPFYAVDCDKQSNKKLCAEQGVQGFPTIKLFPRGGQSKPLDFDGPQRSASAFYYWASRNIPHNVKKVYHLEDLPAWIEENKDAPRAVLLNQGKHIPLLWQTLGNKYKGQIKFAIHRDRRGKSSEKMGLEKGEPKSSKVLLYPPGSTDYVRYSGIQKHDSLSKFFDSVLDGTADLTILNKQAAEEEFVPDEEMLEIERKQEAQRMALAHGGFTDLIDFEEAIKNGAGADFHDKHGYPGMMGGGAPKKTDAKGEGEGKKEDPIHRILKAQQEAEKKEREKPKMAKTDEAGQVVFTPAETGHPKTPVAGETETASSTEVAAAASETPAVDSREDAEVEPEPLSQTPASAAHTDTLKETSEPVIDASSEAVPPPSEEAPRATGHVTDEL
ncbi:hypothetical protein L226DRAFT_536484 [Lentinus tigrinus ALCF2SS1-7]|uniref:Thioredoxin domain-containing protein n=1 Tax=Lentinus tigrinus ALCF2SS1-6 TaxID=1328759 RepID=A0A5C2S745_9APHY|nr:hypothetical protein L227DRAFT_576593 [Lentinus tigrinus ALCF2SS1-6]RPD73367.1 hypothetical protein L226DRAFT_536484 [Lentinus tigrinus ALCF2SS1-7]